MCIPVVTLMRFPLLPFRYEEMKYYEKKFLMFQKIDEILKLPKPCVSSNAASFDVNSIVFVFLGNYAVSTGAISSALCQTSILNVSVIICLPSHLLILTIVLCNSNYQGYLNNQFSAFKKQFRKLGYHIKKNLKRNFL